MTELKEKVFENRGKLEDDSMAKYTLSSLENISKDLVEFADYLLGCLHWGNLPTDQIWNGGPSEVSVSSIHILSMDEPARLNLCSGGWWNRPEWRLIVGRSFGSGLWSSCGLDLSSG